MCHFKYRQVPLICAHRHTHAHTQTHTSEYTDTPTHTTTHTAVSCCVCVLSCSAVSDSFVTPWTVASRLLCPCNFPGKNTGAGYHFLLHNFLLSSIKFWDTILFLLSLRKNFNIFTFGIWNICKEPTRGLAIEFQVLITLAEMNIPKTLTPGFWGSRWHLLPSSGKGLASLLWFLLNPCLYSRGQKSSNRACKMAASQTNLAFTYIWTACSEI